MTRPRILPTCLLLLAACGTAPATLPPEPYVEPEPAAPDEPGTVIFKCDQHLRAWHTLMSQPRTGDNREAIDATSRALAAVVHRNRQDLEDAAISGPPRNRAIATAALGFSHDPLVLTTILNNLSDDLELVRSNALLGIGILGLPETPLGPIALTLQLDPTPAIRTTAAFALNRLQEAGLEDPRLTALYLPLLEDEQATVRQQAAMGLGLARSGEAVGPLCTRLSVDPAATVRTGAAWALGQIGDRAAARVLIAALADPDPVTAGVARASLVKIVGADHGADPAGWQSVLEAP